MTTLQDDIIERDFSVQERADLHASGFSIADDRTAHIEGNMTVKWGPWDTGDLCRIVIRLPDGHTIEGDMIAPTINW
ncbi:hypothetical protein JQ582_19870 [Bradyrhizobium japonicum]|uniref:hypothetical protein n=1 Tax=Bradyrhizobium japonicum TaxID=375 RepID=UPI001BAC0E2D|nr:hypothetical protein [Bradyrhizobium japonicum]MBR0746193.1 hypothetical protein [Bradyrhizobium japonicum]